MLKNNRTFFLLFACFMVVGGVLLATIEQGDGIRYFSENRSVAGDQFFAWFTKVGEEFMYLGFFISFLFIRYRYSLLIAISGLLALVVSFLLKMIFGHPRPSVYFREAGVLDQINTIDGVHLLSGHMSFPSGHTTSAFVLFGVVALLFARKWYWNGLIFLVALLIGISRMYLVQHFLKDVYTGAITGVLLSILVYWVNERYTYDDKRWLDRSILWKGKDGA
ncbi:MAG: membrane-associated phospholipid phosphatase [Polaribacter sp.]|jgi:membrane-associated phospholipid phosphatase